MPHFVPDLPLRLSCDTSWFIPMSSTHYPPYEPLKTLKLAVVEAGFYYVMFGFGEAYFSAYLIWMHANSFELGLVMTLPVLLGSLVQIYTTHFVEFFGSRKRFIVWMAGLQGLCHLPLLIVSKFDHKVFWAIFIITIYQTLFRLHVPAWNSLMGDHVQEKKRGEYFGFHKRISNIFILISSIISGVMMLHYQKSPQTVFTGFCAIFSVAFLGRMVSVALLSRHYEVPIDFNHFVHFRFRRDIKVVKQKGLGTLIFTYSLISFAQYVAIPFFAPYMMNVLKFDYFQFGLMSAIVVVGRVLFSSAWGELLDRFGCRKLILINGVGIACLMLPWAYFDTFLPLCILQLISGYFWSGFELAWFQIIMENTQPHNRTQAYTLQQICGGLAMLIGALFGGWIVQHNRLDAQYYIIAFLVSFVFRLVTTLYFGWVNSEQTHREHHFRYRDFVKLFYRAFLDQGIFYVPDFLKRKH